MSYNTFLKFRILDKFEERMANLESVSKEGKLI